MHKRRSEIWEEQKHSKKKLATNNRNFLHDYCKILILHWLQVLQQLNGGKNCKQITPCIKSTTEHGNAKSNFFSYL